MKMLFFVAATIFTGGIFFSSSAKNIKGTWRVQTAQSNCADQIVRIAMDHGIWKGTTDMPAMERYDVPVQNISWQQDSLILDIIAGERIKAKWINENTMTGIIEKSNRTEMVKLSKQ